MAKFEMFGRSVELPAVPAALLQSRDRSAWLHGRYETVRLTESLTALRVHTNDKSFPARPASREAGAWLLIGDVVLTSTQLANELALPTLDPSSAVAFTHVSEAFLAPGTLLNIGLASAKFGGEGGGYQGEHVGGPPLTFRALVGKTWHKTVGHA